MQFVFVVCPDHTHLGPIDQGPFDLVTVVVVVVVRAPAWLGSTA